MQSIVESQFCCLTVEQIELWGIRSEVLLLFLSTPTETWGWWRKVDKNFLEVYFDCYL